MPIIPLRLHFTGNRRRDARVGALAGLATWVVGGLLFTCFDQWNWPHGLPIPYIEFPLLATVCLLFALFAASVLWLSRWHYTRVFLTAMLVTAAAVPPLLGWALMAVQLYLHG